MPDSSGSIDLGAQREQEAPKEQEQPTGESNEGQPTQLLTAFLVLVHPDGNPEVQAFDHPSLQVTFPPSPDLVYGAVATLQKDLSGSEIAQAAGHAVVTVMEGKAREAFEAQQAAAVQSRLGNLRG